MFLCVEWLCGMLFLVLSLALAVLSLPIRITCCYFVVWWFSCNVDFTVVSVSQPPHSKQSQRHTAKQSIVVSSYLFGLWVSITFEIRIEFLKRQTRFFITSCGYSIALNIHILKATTTTTIHTYTHTHTHSRAY